MKKIAEKKGLQLTIDEGYKCLYSLLLTGKPEITEVVYTNSFIHVCTRGGYIHLNFINKQLEVYGTRFYNDRLIIPAASDYTIKITENVFYNG